MEFNGINISDVEFTGDVNNLYQGESVFAKQLICVAKYWYDKKVRETSPNTSVDINKFWSDYSNNRKKQQAWCSVFAWFLMNEASKTLGCTHKFPGYTETWGNTYDTYQKSISRFGVTDKAIPGTIFYRKSKGTGSSGHMGLVIADDPTKNKFYTIEGNIVLNDGSEGIGAWSYDYSDIQSMGFVFIRTDLNPCNAQKVLAYKERRCEKPEVIVEKKPEKTETERDVPEKIVRVVDRPDGTKDQNSRDFELFKQQKEKEIKRKDCVKIILPSKEKVKHYSYLLENRVRADITGANANYAGVSLEQRNGSALWYDKVNIAENQVGGKTGFGIFRDDVGNSYYIIDGTSTAGANLYESELLKSINPFVVHLEGYTHVGSAEYKGELLKHWYKFKGNKGLEYDYPASFPAALRELLVQRIGSVDSFVKRGDGKEYRDYANFNYLSVINLMAAIEKHNIQVGTIVFYMHKDNSYASDLKKSITLSLNLVAKLVPIIPAFSALATAAQATILGAINVVSDAVTNGVTWKDLGRIGQNVAKLAELIAPEAVKGIKSDVNNMFGDVLNFTQKTVDDIFNPRIRADLQNIATTLGTSVKWLEGMWNNYADDVNGYMALLNSKSGQELIFGKNAMQNAKNMFLMEQIRKLSNVGNLAVQAGTQNVITDIPVMRDLLIAGGSDTAFPAIPKLDQFVGALSKNYYSWGYLNNDQRQGLIAASFGYTPARDVFDDLVLESLQKEATRFAEKNVPFLFPDSIPVSKRECYQYEIEQTVTKNIAGCREGEYWDHNLRKCVTASTGRGFEGNVTGEIKRYDEQPPPPEKRDETPGSSIIPKLPPVERKDPELPPCIIVVNGKYYFRYITNQSAIQSNPVIDAAVKKTDPKQSPIITSTKTPLLAPSGLTAGLLEPRPSMFGTLSDLIPDGSLPLAPAANTNENLYEAKYVYNSGFGSWYALINGQWLQVSEDCKIIEPIKRPPVEQQPNKEVIPVIPVIPGPPKEQLPGCIEVINNLYYYKENTEYYEAKKGTDGKFYANYQGQWLIIVNCKVQKPVIPPPVPDEPYKPYNPPPVPDEPYKPYNPPPVPNEPYRPYSPPPEKSFKTKDEKGDCPNCPKMVKRNETIIYDYPKCDEHCCDRNEFY